MRHIPPRSLDALEPLLIDLRQIAQLREKSRGVFYRKSKAFLHFHEDAAGFFADVRLDPSAESFQRLRVSTKAEQRKLLRAVRRSLS